MSDFLIHVNIGTQSFYLLPFSVSREDSNVWSIIDASWWEEETHKQMGYHKERSEVSVATL